MKPQEKFATAIFASLFVGFGIGIITCRGFRQNDIQWKLSDAAGRGDLAALKYLISKGADINTVPVDGSVEGDSPILEAALHGKPNSALWLIKHGANVNASDGLGTALDMAEEHLKEAQDTVAILKEHGAIGYEKQ